MKSKIASQRPTAFYAGILITLTLIAMLVFYVNDAYATNHLSKLKTDVNDTFGGSSDVPYYLLLAEFVVGAMAYIKTKNIMVLVGVPVMMIFTHFALS